MTISSTIEQALYNGYEFDTTSTGDMLFRSMASNTICIGIGSNIPSILSITPSNTMVASLSNASIALYRTGSNGTLAGNDIVGTIAFSNATMACAISSVYVGNGSNRLADVAMTSSSNENMRITNIGNIGIGTSNPSYKLHVDQSMGAIALNENGLVMAEHYALSNVLSNLVSVNTHTSTSNWLGSSRAQSKALSNYVPLSSFTSYASWSPSQYGPSNALANASNIVASTSNFVYTDHYWTRSTSNVIGPSNIAIAKTTASYTVDVNGIANTTSFTENGVLMSTKYTQSNTLSNCLNQQAMPSLYAPSNVLSVLSNVSIWSSNTAAWTSNNGISLSGGSLVQSMTISLSGGIVVSFNTINFVALPTVVANSVKFTSITSSNMTFSILVVPGNQSGNTANQTSISSSNIVASNITATITSATTYIENGSNIGSKYAKQTDVSNYIALSNAYTSFVANGTMSNVVNMATYGSNTATWASNNIIPGASVMPSGSIVMFGGVTAPSGWLICDGSAVSRTAYAALYSIFGTIYGSGDGTTFNLPDMRGKHVTGYNGSDTNFNAVGRQGGNSTVTLTTDTIPSHTHIFSSSNGNWIGIHGTHFHGDAANAAAPTTAAAAAAGASTGSYPAGSHSHSVDYKLIDKFTGDGTQYPLIDAIDPSWASYGGISSVTATSGSSAWANNAGYNNTATSYTGVSINSAGAGQPISIINPYVVVQYIIKT